MIFAFDLDGVLADTKLAVKTAYLEAGWLPPEDFWGKTRHEWGCPDAVHAEKTKNFRKLSHLIKPLPTLEIFKLIPEEKRVILTGASYKSASVTLSAIGLTAPITIKTSLTIKDKADLLNRYEECLMFEDVLENVQYLKEHTKCQVFLVT